MSYFYLLLSSLFLLSIIIGLLNRFLEIDITAAAFGGIAIMLLGLVLDNQKEILRRLKGEE